jgi:hypothetical protein
VAAANRPGWSGLLPGPEQANDNPQPQQQWQWWQQQQQQQQWQWQQQQWQWWQQQQQWQWWQQQQQWQWWQQQQQQAMQSRPAVVKVLNSNAMTLHGSTSLKFRHCAEVGVKCASVTAMRFINMLNNDMVVRDGAHSIAAAAAIPVTDKLLPLGGHCRRLIG